MILFLVMIILTNAQAYDCEIKRLGDNDLIIKNNYTLEWENFNLHNPTTTFYQVQYKNITTENWINLSEPLLANSNQYNINTNEITDGYEYIFRIINGNYETVAETTTQVIIDNIYPVINVISDDNSVTEVNTNNIEIYVNDINVDPTLLEYRISKDTNCENDTIYVGEYLSDIQTLIQERGVFELLKYKHVCVKGGDYAGHETHMYLGTFSSTYLKVGLSDTGKASIKTHAQLFIKKMKDDPSWFDWLLDLVFRW